MALLVLFPSGKNCHNGWSGDTSKFFTVGGMGARSLIVFKSVNFSGLALASIVALLRNARMGVKDIAPAVGSL